MYQEKFSDQVYKLCLLGATDAEMADILDIDESTFHRWKHEHSEFRESIMRGKAAADANVAERLYQRAMGYQHEAVKIFMPQGAERPVYADYTEHYPPDTQAASLWLRNRQPDKWRDRREFTGAEGKDLIPDRASDIERITGAFMAALKTAPDDC